MKDAVTTQFEPLFRPQTIAVVGASGSGNGRQNVYMRRIREFGFTGTIYPIHPTAAQIDGLPAYRSLAETPRCIDYANIAIPAAQIPDVLAAAAGRVRFAQVISSGFGEAAGGVALERQLVEAARAGGMRLLGPNCLGTYSPRGGVTFAEVGPQVPGSVGIVSQSGGLGVDIVRRGVQRGLRYSGVVTVGNCADIGCSDLLEFYEADPDTRVIGLYVESAKDGRRLFEILRAARARKPVVILKGGRTREGTAAAQSHTGSLAGDYRAWSALAQQTGCVLVNTLDEFLDVLLIFQMLEPNAQRPVREVALFGNGGGTSVLAADCYSELGLSVGPFDAATVDALSLLGLPAGSSVTNPVDCPAGNLRKDDSVARRVLDIIYRLADVQAVVVHVNLTTFVGHGNLDPVEKLMRAALDVQKNYPGRAHFVLVLRTDGEAQLEALRARMRIHAGELGVPVYNELTQAGTALAALSRHERFVQTRGQSS